MLDDSKLTRKQEGFGKPRAATAVMDMVWQRGGNGLVWLG